MDPITSAGTNPNSTNMPPAAPMASPQTNSSTTTPTPLPPVAPKAPTPQPQSVNPPPKPNPNVLNSKPIFSSPPPVIPPAAIKPMTNPSGKSGGGLSKVMGILVLLVLLAVGSIAFFYWQTYINKPQDTANQPITLNYWGLWEPAEVMQPVIDEYQKVHPNVTV